MEGEIIEETHTTGILERIEVWQTIKSKHFHRWFRRLHRRIEARREYVRERDAKREKE